MVSSRSGGATVGVWLKVIPDDAVYPPERSIAPGSARVEKLIRRRRYRSRPKTSATRTTRAIRTASAIQRPWDTLTLFQAVRCRSVTGACPGPPIRS
ncbi:hypothetical protein I548_0480 [Mycobacterium intracellulare]|nr:hypothetical protein I548_0480 [Mycobacterium intracellulare]